jgi:hypothetical protein
MIIVGGMTIVNAVELLTAVADLARENEVAAQQGEAAARPRPGR